MRLTFTALCAVGALAFPAAAARKVPRADAPATNRTILAHPDVTTALPPAAPSPQQQPAVKPPPPPPPAVPPRRFGRFDLDLPFAQLKAMPDLKACADALAAPSGRADCPLPRDADKLARAQIAWEETKNGPETIALRLEF